VTAETWVAEAKSGGGDGGGAGGLSGGAAGEGGAVEVDGNRLAQPYEFLAIGDPQALEVALSIPGGAIPSIERAGGDARVEARPLVAITAVKALRDFRFASPDPEG
jgi:uncharacterized protein YlxW (UPF0749 family)